jgi:hypothetical protein
MLLIAKEPPCLPVHDHEQLVNQYIFREQRHDGTDGNAILADKDLCLSEKQG